MLNLTHYIGEIGRGKDGARDMTEQEACELFGAMLDGGVPDLELGAILIALRVKIRIRRRTARLFTVPADQRLIRLDRPRAAKVVPVVIPSYNGARHPGQSDAVAGCCCCSASMCQC